jgi:hypothetical protein
MVPLLILINTMAIVLAGKVMYLLVDAEVQGDVPCICVRLEINIRLYHMYVRHAFVILVFCIPCYKLRQIVSNS